jgi:K+-transporting ATPase ATPase C chain
MWRQMMPAIRFTLVLTLLTGVAYPLAITGLCQWMFPAKANGSLLMKDQHIVGSALIGQNFTKAEYFQPRPSAAGDGYDAANSSASNLGPTSKKLADRIATDAAKFRADNPKFTGPLPADLLTSSGSGLDPHLSPESVEAQVGRVAAARHVAMDQVRSIVAQYTEGRDLGFLGEARVNVLKLNLALDESLPKRP